VRHPGLTVCLLNYLENSQGIYGARIYVKGPGHIYWKAFIKHYHLPLDGVGMVVYDENGTQTFHSGHRYADVFNVSSTRNSNHYVKDGYYLLLMPGVIDFQYTTEYSYTRYPAYGYVCEWVQVPYTYSAPETQCSYVYGDGYVCETVYVTKTGYRMENQCEWGQIGYNYTYYTHHYIDKYLTGVYQDGTQLRRHKFKITDRAHVLTYVSGESTETGPGAFLPGWTGSVYDINNSFNVVGHTNAFISVT